MYSGYCYYNVHIPTFKSEESTTAHTQDTVSSLRVLFTMCHRSVNVFQNKGMILEHPW